MNKFIRPAIFLISVCFILGITLSAYKSPTENVVAAEVKKKFIDDISVLQEKCSKLTQSLELLQTKHQVLTQTQKAFHYTKKAYKRIEYLLEYLDPELAKLLNGAPIPKVEVSDASYLRLGHIKPQFVVFQPEGLQVMEELLFAENEEEVNEEAIAELLTLSYRLHEKVNLFAASLPNQQITDKQILESIREELLRIMTMGITGFDAPAGGMEIQNISTSLQPVLESLQLYENATTGSANTQCNKTVEILEKAAKYLQEKDDFENFNRLYFIRELIDPAYTLVTKIQPEILSYLINEKTVLRAVNDQAESLFSVDFLNTNYFAKQDREKQTPELISLGRTLFFDPALSGNNERSCASCHKADKAFTDGLQRSIAFDNKGEVTRNSPTLLNVIYSKAYFWDNRVEFLQDQIPEVVTNPFEIHGNYKDVVIKLEQSKEYRSLFKKNFTNQPGNPINTNTINRAIASYIQSLTALNSPFDKYIRHETEELNESAKRGFNLFMGKAACGTCHFAPIFNGTVPPRFMESEAEVLGVPSNADLKNPVLDSDLGKAVKIPADELKHAFKTQTIRNAPLTAPYMHNGVFVTLEEVIEFYDLGGGAGLGLNVPNQTLPSDKLNLNAQEKKDIIAFIHSLTDTTGTISIPNKLPKFQVNGKLNERVIGGKY